jgi:acyl-CoA synthetase (AMP-forming)/AMP-acid ligase II
MSGEARVQFRATVPDMLNHSVAIYGGREMVVTDRERWTYAQIEVTSRALAKSLIAAGVGKGTRVGTQFPYGPQWILTWLALNRVGALHMPFSSALKPPELAKMLRQGDVELFISPDKLFGVERRTYLDEAIPGVTFGSEDPMLRSELPYLRSLWMLRSEGVATTAVAGAVGSIRPSDISDGLLDAIQGQVTPGDWAVTIFTSGTSSDPKAVLHTHGALVRKGAHLAALQGWNSDDRIFCGMPFFWVGGLAMTVVPAIYAGATLLCLDRTDPERALDLMEKEQATRMTGWPGVRVPIEGHPTRTSRKIPAFEGLPPGGNIPRLAQGIGMTETLASYTYNRLDHDVRDGQYRSTGQPIGGAEIRIADPDTLTPIVDGKEGAILVRGYFVTAGFYKKERSEVFTPDGFYNTGDKGYLRDGELYFTGRLTEMIKTSGNNVAPPEVEAVFRSLPEVEDAHVLGVPDDTRGEIVAALVVLSDGASIRPDDLRERVREQLSNYKVPRAVFIVEKGEVPWLASGKPDRISIRRLLASKVAASG